MSTASSQPSPTAKSSTSPRLHLAYLDGLRAMAALYVVWFHALIQIEPNGFGLTGLEKVIGVFFTFGHQAVDLFIVISGFCLMLPVLKTDGILSGGVLTFFKKRVRRILPPYYIALAFTLIAIGTVIGHKTGTGWDVVLPVTPKGLWAHILLFQDVLPDTADKINGAFWSISVEWRIYFAFPFLLFLWRKIGPFASTALAILTSYAMLYIFGRPWLSTFNPNSLVGVMPHYLSLFTLGMLGATFCYSREVKIASLRQSIPWVPLMHGSFVLAVLLCRANRLHGAEVPIAWSDLAVGIWSMLLLITISLYETNPVRRFLSWKPLVFVGTFAYSIYLMHGPIQQVVWQMLLNPLHLPIFIVFVLQCTIGTAVVVGASYLFFLMGERPFLRSPKKPSVTDISGGRLVHKESLP